MKFVNRREFIKVGAMTSAAVAVAGIGPAWGSATAENPKMSAAEAKSQKALAEAEIKKITGGSAVTKGPLQITTQVIAENGAVVPLTIKTGKAKINRIAVIVDNNPEPLIFDVKIDPATAGEGMISTRIRMKQTSDVRVFAFDTDGKIYGDSRMVKVTIGGC